MGTRAREKSRLKRRAAMRRRTQSSPRAVQTPNLQDVLPPKTYGAVVQHLRTCSYFRIDWERVTRRVLNLQRHGLGNGVWLDRADLRHTAPRSLPDRVACGACG